VSERNVELIRRSAERWSDFFSMSPDDLRAGMTELFDPQVEWRDQRELPGATVHHGIEGVMCHLSAAMETLDYEGVDLLDVLDAGESVVAVYRFRARGRASGVPVERDAAYVWGFRGNKVARVAIYGSRNEALEAAGRQE
jgi:ketosteroid isomerase-like protein